MEFQQCHIFSNAAIPHRPDRLLMISSDIFNACNKGYGELTLLFAHCYRTLVQITGSKVVWSMSTIWVYVWC